VHLFTPHHRSSWRWRCSKTLPRCCCSRQRCGQAHGQLTGRRQDACARGAQSARSLLGYTLALRSGTRIGGPPGSLLRRLPLDLEGGQPSEPHLLAAVAELIGADTDSERAIRWLLALMVLCCDPLAIALTAAASACDSLSKSTFGQGLLDAMSVSLESAPSAQRQREAGRPLRQTCSAPLPRAASDYHRQSKFDELESCQNHAFLHILDSNA
jgi:hypothetical protein